MMNSSGTNDTVANVTTRRIPELLPYLASTTDLYRMCRLCLETLSADEGTSLFNNQVPSLPEKIYRLFGVTVLLHLAFRFYRLVFIRAYYFNETLSMFITVLFTSGGGFFVESMWCIVSTGGKY